MNLIIEAKQPDEKVNAILHVAVWYLNRAIDFSDYKAKVVQELGLEKKLFNDKDYKIGRSGSHVWISKMDNTRIALITEEK